MVNLVGDRELDTLDLVFRLMSLDLKILNIYDDFSISRDTVSLSDDDVDEFGEDFSSGENSIFSGKLDFKKDADGTFTNLSGQITAISGGYYYDDLYETRSYNYKLTGVRISVEELQTLKGNALAARLFRGSDNIFGSSYADKLSGYAGNDTLVGGAGADTLDGGKGGDTASYETATKGVSAYLGKPRFNTGDAKGDTYASIENLRGSDFADMLYGNNGANTVSGGAGSDRIGGRDGKDTIETGSGWDSIVFNTALDAKSNVDVVSDFSHKYDRFELDRSFFEGLTAGKLAKMAFALGTKAVDKDDHILYDRKHGDLFFDHDGRGGDSAVKLAEVKDGTNLDHTDFLVV